VLQKVLAVDDQPHMLVLLERIIKERTDYEFASTNNPLEIPGLLERDEYDVLISDLKMPGMDGLEILNYIIQHKRREKIIIITAFGDMETAIKAMQGGAFDYITKPFKKEQILHTVDRAMSRQVLEREAIAMEKMCAKEPYAAAEEIFRAKYIRLLAKRCRDDVEKISTRSGLGAEEVKRILGSS
jgi:DNA-binding NtrC family response regulator